MTTQVERMDSTRMQSKRDVRPPLIAHVIHRLQPGGMENGLINLINNLSPDRYRHAIVCMTESSDFASRIHAKGVDVYELHKKEGKDWGFYRRFWQTMRLIRPALVHTRNLGTLDLVFLSAAAGVAARVHGEHGWDMSDPQGGNQKYRILRKVVDRVVSEYVAVSKNIESWLVSGIGVPAQKIRQIYNGVDISRFSPTSGRSYEDVSISSELVVGTVGRLDPIKNHVWMVRAIATLLRELPELAGTLRVVIAGEGSERDRIQAQIDELGLSDTVRLLGMRDDVPNLMREMDVFVLPSINEGISNTLLEAMASGLPVIASDVGGNPELVRDSVTGYLVSPDNSQGFVEALKKYMQTPTLRKSHGEAARFRVVSEFSLQSMIAAYDELYDRHLSVVHHQRVH